MSRDTMPCSADEPAFTVMVLTDGVSSMFAQNECVVVFSVQQNGTEKSQKRESTVCNAEEKARRV